MLAMTNEHIECSWSAPKKQVRVPIKNAAGSLLFTHGLSETGQKVVWRVGEQAKGKQMSIGWKMAAEGLVVLLSVVVFWIVYDAIHTRRKEKAKRVREDQAERVNRGNIEFLSERGLIHPSMDQINPGIKIYYLDRCGDLKSLALLNFRREIDALERLGLPIPKVIIFDTHFNLPAAPLFSSGSISWSFEWGGWLFPCILVDHRGNMLKVVLHSEATQDAYLAEMLRIMAAHDTVREYAYAYRMQIAASRIALTRSTMRSPALAEIRALLENRGLEAFSECHQPDARFMEGIV